MGLNFLWTTSYLPEIADDLTTIRAAGIDILFNYLMGQGPAWANLPVPASDAEMLAWLDALDAAGLKTMLCVRELGPIIINPREDKVLSPAELAAITAYVNKWKTYPAVWGWYADDESGITYPIAARQQVYDTIKAAHPAGQVVETHYDLVAGAYSPDVHDVFAMDAGPSAGASYVYLYDDSPPRGCISKATGLVTSQTVETRELDAFQANLVRLKAELVAAGETQYLVCMQAFGQGPEKPDNYRYAMPPLGGILRIGVKARAAGWGDYGVGFFIWKADPTTTPLEHVNGVSEGPNAAALVAEMAAVTTLTHPSATAPTLAAYEVKVAGNDVTELVDMDTLHRSMSERGEASATIDIPVATENEVPVNGLVRDAVVEIVVDGGREWLGHVVAVHKPKPQDLSYVLDCAGGWDTLHHCAPWCRGFVETRYDAVTEYPPSAALFSSVFTPTTAIDVSTDGEILFTLPKGTTLKANQCKFLYLHILGGLADGFSINRITCDVATSGSGVMRWGIHAIGPNPFASTYSVLVGTGLTTSASIAVDVDTTSGGGPLTALNFQFAPDSDVAAQTSDQTFQVRNIRAYIDRTTAPRVDEIVAAIDAEVRPDAPAASTEAIGAPLTAFMLDPFMTPADGIAVALSKAAVPPLCGIVQNQFIIKNRPTTPPDATRMWTVSEQITPGLEWGVEVDEEQSVDYVGVAYSTIGLAPFPDGTPHIMYWPIPGPPNAAARTAIIDGGDLTGDEAEFYARQGYHYLHKLVSGPVTIPYVVQDANGNERPADMIRAWDWVHNVGSLDADTAGPFLVSEVEHQGHIATLVVGATEAYAYNGPDRLPVKGRYVGAHRVRTKFKKRVSFAEYWKWKHRGRKRKPKMPKRHARYGTIRGYKWQDVEGRYT